jgi:drug/metabolite transporter (DMT)-like permease
MREEEIHLYGLSRLPLRAAVGLGCPVLVFLRIRTSHKRAFCNAVDCSVSCAPCFCLTLRRNSRISTESRLTRREVVGLVVAFGGIVLIASPSPSQFGGGMSGEPILLLGAGCFALGSVITQRVTAPLPAETQQAWAMGIGALLIYIASVTLGESVMSVRWTGEALGALSYLILVPSGLGFLCYFKILDRFDSIEANLVMNASPIFAALLGWVVLNEGLGLVTIGGFAAILLGFILLLSPKPTAQRLLSRLS